MWRLIWDTHRSTITNSGKDSVRRSREKNPEAIILAEHYGDPFCMVRWNPQWDTVMNYDAFMEPISWFLTGMEKHSDARRSDLRGNAAAFFGSMTDYGARFTNAKCFSGDE